MPKSAREVASALEAKGFLKTENDHSFFTLWVEGKKIIYTKISHGEKELGDGLLGRMAKQLQMTRSQLLEFVKCDLTSAAYVQHLRDTNRIPAPKKPNAATPMRPLTPTRRRKFK